MAQYLIYLRKSRQDRELELATGNQDTLQRHRTKLLSIAKEQKLHIAEILEEIVSGDTIAARPAMQRLLSLVETGKYAGVLCMEVARLMSEFKGSVCFAGNGINCFRAFVFKYDIQGRILQLSEFSFNLITLILAASYQSQ